MNRRLLLVPVIGVAAVAGSQLLSGGGSELPPEPVFPTAVATDANQGWTDDAWSVNRFVDDPFDAALTGRAADGADPFVPSAEVGLEAEPAPTTTVEVAATSSPSPTTTTAPVPTTTATSTTTTTPPPPTTARDLSQAPPLPEDGSGVDLPAIDDLPDPLGGGDTDDR